MSERRCPACESDLSQEAIGIPECPVCGSPLNIVIDLREPSERIIPTVLIVDDDSEIRKVLTAVLEGNGFQLVGEVSNGPDAVLASQRTRPTYVFLDQFMPAITGEETAKLIREVSPDSIIVAFSGLLDEQPAWADSHLPKTAVGSAAALLRELESSDVKKRG